MNFRWINWMNVNIDGLKNEKSDDGCASMIKEQM